MENINRTFYSRQLDIQEKFNHFWNQALKTKNENYLSKLTNEDLIGLKKAIANTNNLLTLKVTLGFIDRLHSLGIIDSNQADRIKKNVDGQHPNTNGFDVQDTECGIIAEVKCNIPVGEKSFGAAQKNALKKDLQGLRNGKTKGGIVNTDDYYKFMVVLDVDGVRDAMKKLCGDDRCIELVDKNIDTNHIYIVYIKI